MLHKVLVIVMLGIAILAGPQIHYTHAEELLPRGLEKISDSVNRFGKDVNQLGKNIVGLVLSNDTKAQSKADAQPIDQQYDQEGRAGSVFSRYRSPMKYGKKATSSSQAASETSSKEEATAARSEERRSDRWPYDESKQSDANRSELQNQTETVMAVPLTSATSVTSQETTDTDISNTSPIRTQQPLYKRLQTLKTSPFAVSSTSQKTSSQIQAQRVQVEPTEAVPVESSQAIQGRTPSRYPSRGSNTTSGPTLKQPSLKTTSSQNSLRKATMAPSQTNQPAQRIGSEPTRRITVATRPQTTPVAEDVLIQRDCPILNVQTNGPSKINIGREAEYKVLLKNEGEIAAREVLVTVDLPAWADVIGAKADQGTAAIDRSAASRRLCWRLETLPGKTAREMSLRLIPRERRPIELAVRSSFTQIASQAVIEVQEPQLSMRLIGPKEVKLGKAELFQLEILNSGNGTAEDMVLTLLLPSTKSELPTTHKLGDLEADAKRVLDLELTAQQLENISVEANLRCTAAKGARMIEKLVVLSPQVKAGVYGPAVRFLGTRGAYQIKVANFGNLEANNLHVKAIVPQEAKFIKGTEGVQFEAHSNTAVWKIDSLEPGKEEILELECEMIDQGTAKLLVNIEDGQYTELSKVAAIRVEAMADLAMEVVDPSGPVSLGEEAVYEIHIHNRGTRPAESVNAVAYFSEGVEPVSADGVKNRIAPGQVSFQTISSIPPNESVVLKVRAVAQKTGNHMFRAETECASLGTKLIGEETTHFYRGAKLAGDEDLSREPSQTADRRNQPTLAPQRSEPFQR